MLATRKDKPGLSIPIECNTDSTISLAAENGNAKANPPPIHLKEKRFIPSRLNERACPTIPPSKPMQITIYSAYNWLN